MRLCLRPILFHIILKHYENGDAIGVSLRPILFHIILKLAISCNVLPFCLRPILFHIILKRTKLFFNRFLA